MKVGPEHLEWWLDKYREYKWTFAKSYAETAPHTYVVKNKTISAREFNLALSVIRTFGEPQKYWRSTNIYLVGDGQKWWSNDQGDHRDFVIINKAPDDQFFGTQDAPKTKSRHWSVYDSIALDYDLMAPNTHDTELAEIVKAHLHTPWPVTLDVGVGTGKSLELGITTPGRMVAVDPSQGMLNGLVWKYHYPPLRENLGAVVPKKIEETYAEFEDGEFDLVIGLYGSPSYVFPDLVEMLPRLGRWTVLMTYKPGYLPNWWKGSELPENTETVARVVSRMGGEHYDLGNYDLRIIENKSTLF
jgi:SAM-dependent methyltransferase